VTPKQKDSYFYKSVLAILLLLAFNFYYCEQSGSKIKASIPSYTIIKVEDISSSNAKRLRVKVSIDSLLNEENIKLICNDIINSKSYKKNGIMAIVFFFYLPNTNVNSGYSAALAEWAPNGKWADAAIVKGGNYSQHKFLIKLAEKVDWNDKSGIAVEKRREIFYNLVVVEDSLNSVNAKDISKKSHSIIARKYKVPISVVDDIANEGLIKSWPIP